jgi:hypothetical protein
MGSPRPEARGPRVVYIVWEESRPRLDEEEYRYILGWDYVIGITLVDIIPWPGSGRGLGGGEQAWPWEEESGRAGIGPEINKRGSWLVV